jgi:GH24 family phage-related lysozyme (muramidase)
MAKKTKTRAIRVYKPRPNWALPRQRVEFHLHPILQMLIGGLAVAGILLGVNYLSKKPTEKDIAVSEEPTSIPTEIFISTVIPEPTNTPLPVVSSVSQEGQKFIMIFEALSLVPYNDIGGKCTVGYGHYLYDGPCQSDTPISEAKAVRLFDEDIAITESVLNDDLEDVELNQCQYDALASFIFNVGKYVWRMSSVSIAVRFGELEEVSYQLQRYIYPSGGGYPLASLEFRRRAEGRLFDECRYRPET